MRERRVLGWALGFAVAWLAASRTARAEPLVSLDAGRLRLEIDEHMRSRIVATLDERVGAEIPLGRFAPSEIVVMDRREIRDFARADLAQKVIHDERGGGRQLTVRGQRPGLRQELNFTVYDDFPGFVFLEASYTNTATAPVRIDRWRSRHFLAARRRPARGARLLVLPERLVPRAPRLGAAGAGGFRAARRRPRSSGGHVRAAPRYRWRSTLFSCASWTTAVWYGRGGRDDPRRNMEIRSAPLSALRCRRRLGQKTPGPEGWQGSLPRDGRRN